MFCSKCGAEVPDADNFCSSCGQKVTPAPAAPQPATPTPDAQPTTENVAVPTSPQQQTATTAVPQAAVKQPVRPLVYALAPIGFFIALMVVWGVINLFAGASDAPSSGILVFFNSVFIPFLFALSFFAIPIGIIIAIVKHNTGYTGEIRCGNCHYIGPGRKGRSIWAQVLIWIVFFFFWPATLAYYLLTHSYYCPNCNSSFVGLKNKNGVYNAPSSGSSGILIIVIVVIVIIVIGILASVVLASLSAARDKADDATTRATLSNLTTEAELYAATSEFGYQGFCGQDDTKRQLGLLPRHSENTPQCNDSTKAFAITAETNEGTHFCVDAFGTTVTVAKPLITNQTVCPPAIQSATP